MSLRDMMDDDLVNVFLNEDDHAEPAMFYPHGNTVGFPCTLMRAAAMPSLGGEPILGPTATPIFRGSRAALRAGILALLGEGNERDPQNADTFMLTRTSEEATVQTVAPTPNDDFFLSVSITTIDAVTVSRRT